MIRVNDRAGKIEPDFILFDTILALVQDFPDRFHHPKEDEVLFRLVAARAPEIRDTIALLQVEHHEGVQLTSDLKWKLAARKAAPVQNFADFD